MKIYLAALLILSCYVPSTLAVSDQNICAQSCQYCCRNQACQSQSTCQGNYQPFIIVGAIVGGLIALFIARRVYVHYRNKQMIARGEDPKAKNKDKQGFKSRWRSRRGKSADKEKKEKKGRKDKKEKKEKVRSVKSVKSLKSLKDADENPNKSKGDIYLQIDNESVLSHEDIKSAANKTSGQISSRKELKPNSKNEILVKSDTNLNDKDRLNPYKQNKIPEMPPKDVKGKDDKENKTKDGKARSSSKGKTDKSKKSAMSGSMKDSKMDKSATGKERGRSKEPGGDKKKSTSTGPKGEKSRGASEKTKKNQV